MATNGTKVLSCEGPDPDPHVNPTLEAWFWVLVAVCALIGIFGAIFNSLVLYFANRKTMITTLRHLNNVVRHLAVSDFLIGTLASPLQFVYFKMGKI